MSMVKITTFLKRIGLSDKEAIIYEYLLNKGELSVAELSQVSQLKRGDLYNVLYSLRDRDLVQQVDRGRSSTFSVTDPTLLKNQIEVQKDRLAEAEAATSVLLPKLVSQYTITSNRPSVRYLEGLPGLISVYDELFASKEKEFLLLRSVYDNTTPEISEVINQMVERQIAQKMKVRLIAPLEEKSKRRYLVTDKERGIERRIVEESQLQSPAQIMIWGDCVAIISLKGHTVITLMENADIAQTFRNMFTYMWEKAEPYHDKVVKSWK
ncbi:MAG: helix-turn-helix domain-containing protein [bacterium]